MKRASVGIIANPAAAHDIRRLSGHGSVVDNQEKVRILRRVMLGLQAVGVTEILAMPDPYGLVAAAASAAELHVNLHIVALDCAHDATDSTRAAARMVDAGCACLVTLGGDGTNRAVAQGSGTTPLLAISTGTNNVIPSPIEGTVAGLAAGLFARDLIPPTVAIRPSKRLEVIQADALIETALVDIASSVAGFIGARAVTDTATLRQLWLTQADPGYIGLAAIGAHVQPLARQADAALLIDLATSADEVRAQVLAPIAPGMVRMVALRDWRRLAIGEATVVAHLPCVLALDGERTCIIARDGPPVTIRATWDGPNLLDVSAIMAYAALNGLFLTPHNGVP